MGYSRSARLSLIPRRVTICPAIVVRVAMSVRQAETIRRKDHIPESVRTEGKDDAAENIDRLIQEGKWPVPLTELADATDWSRSHYANTLVDYYEAVDESDTDAAESKEGHTHLNGDGITINVPEDVSSRRDYIRGYVDGYLAEQ